MDRQTGITSKALIKAYEDYGRFVYVINGVHNRCYYKALLVDLKIPSGAVNFVTTYDFNYRPIHANNLPVIIDHHAEHYLNRDVREYISIFNLRLSQRKEIERAIRSW